MRRTVLILVSIIFSSIPLKAFAWDPARPLDDVKKVIGDAVNDVVNSFTEAKITDAIKLSFPLSEAINEAAKSSGDQTLVSAVNSFQAIGAKLDTESQTAITNALTNPSKGVRDAAQNIIKSANDGIQAIQAAERFAERAVADSQEVLNQAEKRVREGKVVDAVWHLSTDKLIHDSANGAQLMRESDVARDTAKSLVSAQAGPAGTAAFAAWYEYYNSKGDVQKALFTGLYTYAVASGNADINKMSSGTIEETVRKAAAAAALRGVAVAAAGGSQQDILNAAAQSGGSVIVQSGQAYVTKEYIDPAKAKADQFCIDAVDETCGDAAQWIDDTKKQLEDYNDQLAHVGSLNDSLPTSVVTADGQWAISWNKKALIDPNSKTPGAVLTYVGPGSLYRKQMTDLAAIGRGNGLFPFNGPSISENPDKFSGAFPDGKWKISSEGQRVFVYDTDLFGLPGTVSYFINESPKRVEELSFSIKVLSGWQQHGDDDPTYSGFSSEKVAETCSGQNIEKIELSLIESIGSIDGRPVDSDEDISRYLTFTGPCSVHRRPSDTCEKNWRRKTTSVHFKSKKKVRFSATHDYIYVSQMENHHTERRILSYGHDDCNIYISVKKPLEE